MNFNVKYVHVTSHVVLLSWPRMNQGATSSTSAPCLGSVILVNPKAAYSVTKIGILSVTSTTAVIYAGKCVRLHAMVLVSPILRQ